MPGTTSYAALPYPLNSEPFADGAEAIQALADDLDNKLGQFLRARRVTTQTISAATTTEVQWTAGDSTVSGDFDLTNGDTTDSQFTYNGPDRFILISAVVQFQLSVTSGTAVVQLQRVGAGEPFVHTDRRDFSELNSASPLGVSGMVWAETGDVFRLLVTHTTGSNKTVQAYLNAKVVL